MKYLIRLYRYIFARSLFSRLNKLIYRLSLSGMGVLNFENPKISGEEWFLRNYLQSKPEGVVMDIGAHVGDYSRMVLDFMPEASVYAFEPHPKSFRRLVLRFSQENFTPINAAVGAENGMLSLFDYEDRDGSCHASLFEDVILDIHKSHATQHDVQVTTLDEFAALQKIRIIALLKIDVEGNEFNVIRGAKKLLDSGSISVIQFEFNEMNIYSSTRFKDFWDALKGYDLYRLLPRDLLRLDTYQPVYCEIFAYQNIIAISKSIGWSRDRIVG